MAELIPADDAGIARAAERLQQGMLAAFPTETVYGLGADARSDAAVTRIYAAKERPSFNPLIAHFLAAEAALAETVPNSAAETLAERFWPGALTLVLPRAKDCAISLLATAGLDTIAVRVPAHPVAHALLVSAGCPVAAPSANPSGAISATEARHVADAFPKAELLVIDGGPCLIGLESTVLDLSGDRPCLLRPGGLSAEAIAEALGHAPDIAGDAQPGAQPGAPRSPGMTECHYAPRTPLRCNATEAEPGEVMLGFGPNSADALLNLSVTGNLEEAAANLFAFLHRLDRQDCAGIVVAPVPEQGLGRAINDRLRRAATAHAGPVAA